MLLAWDIETNSLDPFKEGSRILSSAVLTEYGEYYAEVRDFKIQKLMLENPQNTVIGHNIISFDIPWWEHHVGKVNAEVWDSRVASSLLDETGQDNSLAGLAMNLCGIQLSQEMKSKRKKLAEVPISKLLEYNKQDVHASFEIYKVLKEQLIEAGQYELFKWIMGVSPSVSHMMTTGVLIDTDWIKEQDEKIEQDKEEVKRSLMAPIGREDFNLNSTSQIGHLLFEEWGMVPTKRTLKGAPSTSVEAIKDLSQRYTGPVRQWLLDFLEYRALTKLQGTYLRPFMGHRLGSDGRIHTSYFMGKGYGDRDSKGGGTVTGRLTSSDPNLQNIPRGTIIKGSFVPDEGCSFFDVDYSQVEIRIAGVYSQEPAMLEAFEKNRDIHCQTLAKISNMDYDEVVGLVKEDPKWKEKRTQIKPVNFGVLYGISAFSLTQTLKNMGMKQTIWQSERLINDWFRAFPAVASWVTDTRNKIQRNGFVRTPTGRVRRLGSNPSEHELRQGVNFLIQSLASDCTLSALKVLHNNLEHGQILLTVHDSILGQYDKSKWTDEGLTRFINTCMIDLVNEDMRINFDLPTLPLAVDVDTSIERWGK